MSGVQQGVEPLVECHDLFKIYKRAELEVVALRGLDMEIARGEFLAIVGASGSGKTSLLNILAGLDRPSAGQVRVGKRDLLATRERDLVLYRREEVGFVWQVVGRNLLPYLNALDNVELPMAIAGRPRQARRERAQELLAVLGLSDKADRLPHQLSGGEQQRLGIAVALANNPPLLLADEPTGELDTQTGVQVFEALRAMSKTYGVTVVVVTHYPGVARFVDRVVQIRDGRISTEFLMQPTFQHPGESLLQEYLLVDQVGRLQLPQEYVEKLKLKGRVKVQVDDGQVTIRPAK
ncbi:MAG: ABC transporter ATP-binding protein [Chloroflexi bacterium]|nr:ABC transporter ATP-binding protein [Chloroflexota bacterium]